MAIKELLPHLRADREMAKRFKLEYELVLNDVLIALGMGAAFAGTADGLLITDSVRTATADDWRVLGGLATGNQAFGIVQIDPARPGHVITMTELPASTRRWVASSM